MNDNKYEIERREYKSKIDRLEKSYSSISKKFELMNYNLNKYQYSYDSLKIKIKKVQNENINSGSNIKHFTVNQLDSFWSGLGYIGN